MIGRIRAAIAARPRDPGDLAGGLPWEAIYPHEPAPAIARPATAPQPFRRVAAATTPAQLALANPARRSLVIYNDSTATLYVKHGPGASTTAGGYTGQVTPAGTYVLEPPDVYAGEVSGVWTAANGAASVTEQ